MPLGKMTASFFNKLKENQLKTNVSSPEEIISRDGIKKYRESAVEFYSQNCHTKLLSSVSLKIMEIPGPDDNRLEARMYTDVNCNSSAPVLIYFAGGAGVLNIEVYDNVCSVIAKESGCVVIKVNCRLAPEHVRTDAFRDAYFATKYFYKNAETFGFNKEKFAVGGNSSGGTLAALVVNKARNESESDLNIKMQILISPRVDSSLELSKREEYLRYQKEDIMLPPGDQEFFARISLPENLNRKEPSVSPYYDNLTGVPPTLIIVGEFDALRSDAEFYYQKLIENGVDAEKVVGEGQVHGALICRKVMNDGPDQAELVGRRLFEKFND